MSHLATPAGSAAGVCTGCSARPSTGGRFERKARSFPDPRAVGSQRWIIRGAALGLVLGGLLPSVGAPPAAASPAGVVDLPQGGFLPGRLVPVPAEEGPRTTLLWQTPLFEEPAEFAIDGIERIRFPKAATEALAADAWRVELAGKDGLVGRLDSIDAEHVVLTVSGVGPGALRLRRGEVERLSRVVGGQVGEQVILPGPLAGWKAERTGWQEVAGRLVGRMPGSSAFRETGSPARACFEILLSWEVRPDLEILLAARPNAAARLAAPGGRPAADAEDYRLETLAGDLVAIRESKTAAVDRVAVLPAGPGSLRLLVFVDQEQGRMAVLVPDGSGKPAVVFDETIPPRKPSVHGGFGIRLRAGDVRLDGLRVSAWKKPEPRLAEAAEVGRPGAEVESFDGTTGSFTLRSADGLRQVAAADLAEIVFAAPGQDQAPPPPGTMLATFQDGSRLTGRIIEVTTESIRLDCPAAAEPVSCDFGALAAVEPLAERRPVNLPGRPGILEADNGRLAGCLANAAGPATGIAWLPQGGVRPVGIAATARGLRVVYPDSAAAVPAVGDFGPATVYLKSGDSLRCEVLAGGPEGLRIRTSVGSDLLVPTVVLRAVELFPAASAKLSKSGLERLLTLPRSQQSDPPTHLLRLTSGDYLRGKLVALDDLSVVIDLAGIPKRLPRAAVARLIWLSIEGDGSEAEALAAMAAGEEADGVPLRATLKDGRQLTMRASGLEGDKLVGKSGLLEQVGFALADCSRIDLRPVAAVKPTAEIPFSRWKLRPAVLPRTLRDEPKPGGIAKPDPTRAGPEHPLVGRLASVPVLRLLDPVGGREKLSPEWLTGKILTLLIFDPGDPQAVAALGPLQEAIGPLATDGVELVAVSERAEREAVARAVAGLDPRPLIAIDKAGILESRLEKASLPACLIIDREGRVANVVAFKPEAVAGIRTLVADLVDRTRQVAAEFQELARARAAALAGERGCLEPLGKLLDADSELVRRQSITLLRQLTGLSAAALPYSPEAAAAEREGAVRRWRQWLAANGISADLAFPARVAEDSADARPLTGRTLVCRGDRVLELDADGGVVMEYPCRNTWACDVTPNGRRLVGDHGGRAVIEYDDQGNETWAVRGLPGGPMSVRRLQNGNTLVALSDANLVAEYDPQGKLAWSAKVAGRPCDARRLPDGNTLVAAHRANRIVELDAGGNEVWTVEGIEDPQTAQRLPDGNTLVAMSVPGIVREIDRDGRTVWERAGFKTPVDVQRLPDGTTLVQEEGGDLVELHPGGAELRRLPTGGTRFLRW